MSINLKDSEQIQINILTRSANRPVGFYNCYQSVVNQTYKNINHLVSYEYDDDLKDINLIGVNHVKVEKYEGKKLIHPKGYLHAPYNLYCNKLLGKIENGWIMFLDDDDNLIHNKVLKEIVSEIMKVNEDTMLIWQMRYPNGSVLPTKENFISKKILMNQIGSPCFLFHSKYKKYAKWDEWKASDYRVFKSLFDEIPNKQWIEKVYIQINNFGDLGNRNDITKDVKHKIIFRKTLFWNLIPKYHIQFKSIYIFKYETYKDYWARGIKKVKRILQKK